MDIKSLIIIALLALIVGYFVFREDDTRAPDGSAPASGIFDRIKKKGSPVFAATSTPAPTPAPVASPTALLLSFTVKNIDAIFTPVELPCADTPSPRRRRIQVQDEEPKFNSEAALAELAAIYSALRDTQPSVHDEEQLRIYVASNSLCRHLHSAIVERNEHMKRLAHTRDNPSKALDGFKKSSTELQQFFENNIKHSWQTKGKQMRREIQKNYDTLRDLEFQ